jgi:effector-binding domain-containing protein
VYSGPYDNDGLVKATAALLDWAQENHITWQTSMLNDVEWWRARSEFYHTDPAVEPDPEKWQTELVFLTAEA